MVLLQVGYGFGFSRLFSLLIDSLIVVCERASPRESVFGVWAG